jgi:IclR family acetate operon transcriptional repressor
VPEDKSESTSTRSTLGTIRNAMQLLQIMGSEGLYFPLTELSERSGMSLSTTHRVVRSLAAAGVVVQDSRTARYSLGPEIVRLSEGYLSRLPVLRALSPYLVELRMRTRGTILVALRMGTSVVYTDRVDAEETEGIFREGRRLHDAFETAAGRVLIAWADDEVWEEALRTTNLAVDFDDEDRAAVRKTPYLILGPGEFRAGVEVAVPVLDRYGRALAALASVGRPGTFTDAVVAEQVAPALLRAARAAGEAVGDA